MWVTATKWNLSTISCTGMVRCGGAGMGTLRVQKILVVGDEWLASNSSEYCVFIPNCPGVLVSEQQTREFFLIKSTISVCHC